MAPRSILIDCDPGIDDAVAILLTLASPELRLEAITTLAGNVSCPLTTSNALKICALAGQPEIPVYPGCEKPLARPLAVANVHGTSGMDGADLPSPEIAAQSRHGVGWLIEHLGAAARRSATLAAIGPLTNLASALTRAPEIAEKLRDVVIMGGATAAIGGNVTRFAEFNIRTDPEAAAIVFSSGLPITLVTLDLSHQMVVTDRRIAAFETLGNPPGRAVAGMLRFYQKGDPHLHDPLTILWLLYPELFTSRMAYVSVGLDRDRAGQTRFDWAQDGPCRILAKVQVDRAFDVLTERLGRL